MTLSRGLDRDLSRNGTVENDSPISGEVTAVRLPPPAVPAFAMSRLCGMLPDVTAPWFNGSIFLSSRLATVCQLASLLAVKAA